MYREDHDDVVLLGKEVRRRDRLLRLLQAAQSEHAQLRGELAQLEQGLAKEERDVERLEGRSLTRLLLSVAGKVQQRLDQERREALEARLRVEAKGVEVQLAQAELERIGESLRALEGIDSRYARAFEDKVARVVQEAGEGAQRITGLIEEGIEAARWLRELDEAYEAGRWAERYLAEALRDIDALEKVEADEMAVLTTTMLVVMTMSTPVPTAHRLEANLQQAHAWLRRYAHELGDLPGWSQTQHAVGTHANLVLSFVNIVGASATKQAKQAKRAIAETREQVRRVQAALEHARPGVVARYDDAMRRYRDAVEFA